MQTDQSIFEEPEVKTCDREELMDSAAFTGSPS